MEEQRTCALEQGEGTPLLYDRCEDAEMRERSSLQNQSFDWRAPTIILGYECFESLGFYGVSTNLVIYLGNILHESNASIASSITAWTGTSYFTPFLGAFIADSYWGGYRMILISSSMDLIGMVLLILSALLPSSASTQKSMFYSGLYLIAFGSGGVKSTLLPLGADQFNDENPVEREKKGSFFNWFYFCMNVGALTSSTIIVWIQENVDWALGFGIAALCMALAVGAFICGTNTYKLQKPSGSPVKRNFQVVIASLRKMNLNLPADCSLLYEKSDSHGIQRLVHTDQFRFIDKAAIILDSDAKDGTGYNPWRLCTVTQVEELKILLRLVPIWLTSIIYSVAYAQMYTTFVEQGRAMDTRIGSFSIPPASLFAFEVISVMFWVLLYDTVIVAIARLCLGNGHGLSQLQRMGIGYLLMTVTMATAALVEVSRLKSVRAGRPIRVTWQLPQYFIVAGSEVFTSIGQLEFFYRQGPNTMRSMCTAISLLSVSLGNYLSSLMVVLVVMLTSRGRKPGWIPDNLNEGHLDYFFWVMAGISILNFVVYVDCARKYTLKRVVQK